MADQIVPVQPEPIAFEIIRTETALSRFPIHRLFGKGDDFNVDIRKQDADGRLALLWKVSYNSEYGQPGPQAYKVDTVVVNERIEEAGQPVPKVLRLGSLSQICENLGLADSGKNRSDIRRALLQNASAFVTAKLTYKSADRAERSVDAGFTRYSVIFTGETLPDGHRADAVYLILNEVYMAILNTAQRRPLDFDYIRELSPAPQRFYEIVSYQIYPAVKYDQRAKLAYSEYCLLSTQVRYYDFEHVKKQMWKVHHPHLRSGYIAKVDYEATTDAAGRPDWTMIYTPGPKAKTEQLVFAFARHIPRRRPAKAKPSEPRKPKTREKLEQPHLPELPLADAALEKAEALVRYFHEVFFGNGSRVNPSEKEVAQAQEHITRLGEDAARFLIEYAHREAPKTKFEIQTYGGILQYEARAMDEYTAKQEQERKTRLEKARKAHQERFSSRYLDYAAQALSELESAPTEAFRAYLDEEDRMLKFHKARAARSERAARFVEEFHTREQRVPRFLDFCGKSKERLILSFWEWDTTLNPTPFSEGA